MRRGKDVLARILSAVLAVSVAVSLTPGNAEAAGKIPTYHKIPAYQQKDVFSTKTVKIPDITVEEALDADGKTTQPLTESVRFRIFNCTKQEVEGYVQSVNGKLSGLNLVNDHNYILFAEDEEYYLAKNVYFWVKDGQPVDIKDVEAANVTYDYPKLTAIKLYKKDGGQGFPREIGDRVTMSSIPVYFGTGDGKLFNKKFLFVSDVETIEGTTGNSGYLRTEEGLLEDVTYMVTVDDPEYDVEAFPIAAKDKTEYEGERYFYDHSSCQKVDEIRLVKKEEAHRNDTTVTSISGNTTITGFNFKDFLILDRKIDRDLSKQLGEKEYDVLDITVVNPHRWEISKLAAGEFKVTETVDPTKKVDHVYYIDAEGELQELDFTQSDDKVNFTMNSLSLHPVVLEYNEIRLPAKKKETPVKVQGIALSGISKKIAAGKSVQLTAEISPANAANPAVTWTSSNEKYAAVNAQGKVTTKKAGAGKSVTITAAAADGSGKKAAYEIRIMKHAVKSIALKAKKSIKAGKTAAVKATVKTTGKNANVKLQWTSSNEKFATVNAKGKVKTKKAGKGKTVKITAKATDGSGKKKTVKIKIK